MHPSRIVTLLLLVCAAKAVRHVCKAQVELWHEERRRKALRNWTNITSVAVLVILFAGTARAADDASLITIDRVSVGKAIAILFHAPGGTIRFALGCTTQRADCVALEPGDKYKLERMRDDDPDSYRRYASFRITGSDASAVYFDPRQAKLATVPTSLSEN